MNIIDKNEAINLLLRRKNEAEKMLQYHKDTDEKAIKLGLNSAKIAEISNKYNDYWNSELDFCNSILHELGVD